MEMMTGKFMMENMDNMDVLWQNMGMTEDVMREMMGSSGMMMDIMIDGRTMTMQRSDGMNMSFMMGKEFEMPMCGMLLKVMPEIEGDMMTMTFKMPNETMMMRQYKANSNNLMIKTMYNNMTMETMYRRMSM